MPMEPGGVAARRAAPPLAKRRLRARRRDGDDCRPLDGRGRAPGGADGCLYSTAELKTSLLRPARCDRLVCRAHVLKPGRQLIFTEANVRCLAGDESHLVSKASATMAVTAPKA